MSGFLPYCFRRSTKCFFLLFSRSFSCKELASCDERRDLERTGTDSESVLTISTGIDRIPRLSPKRDPVITELKGWLVSSIPGAKWGQPHGANKTINDSAHGKWWLSEDGFVLANPIGSVCMPYVVTFTYIYHQYTPVMLPYIRHTYGSVMGMEIVIFSIRHFVEKNPLSSALQFCINALVTSPKARRQTCQF